MAKVFLDLAKIDTMKKEMGGEGCGRKPVSRPLIAADQISSPSVLRKWRYDGGEQYLFEGRQRGSGKETATASFSTWRVWIFSV